MGLFDFLKTKKGIEEEIEMDVTDENESPEDVSESDIVLDDDGNDNINEDKKDNFNPNEDDKSVDNIDEMEFQDGGTVVFDLDDEEIEETDKESEKKVGLFTKMLKGLSKTRENIMNSVENVFKNFKSIDDEFFEELEEALILADIGVKTSTEIIDAMKNRVKEEKIKDTAQVKDLLVEEISNIMSSDISEFKIESPTVILVIGVNGVGKTTTIGKLTKKYKSQGKKVLLAAADTFRAAAIDQLEEWGKRSGVDVIRHQENSDPGAVVFDAVKSAKAKKIDVLICDTAGRLHNKKNLMEELKKISKIIEREFPESHQEVLLVLDGTTGQNALQQAKLFSEVANITGLVLTKLDGTAKGGIVIAIKNEMNIPVRYIGIGEGVDDLEDFDPALFARALFNN